MKTFVQFLLSLLTSILLGILGLGVGATIGGNFGFPAFGGNVGYEAGGVFFAILGISLGSFFFFTLQNKLQSKQFQYKMLLATALTFFKGNKPKANLKICFQSLLFIFQILDQLLRDVFLTR